MSDRLRRIVIILSLFAVTILRRENLPIYLIAITIGWILREYNLRELVRGLSKRGRLAVIGLTVLSLPLVIRAIKWVLVNALASRRAKRARGGSAYLPSIIPDTIFTATWFAPIGMAYFLFSPFPWMVESLIYVPVLIEGLINVAFAVAAIVGARQFISQHPVYAYPLISAFFILSILYGLVEGNVGASLRHRQMVIWVLYVCGGIGFVEWSDLPTLSRQNSGSDIKA